MKYFITLYWIKYLDFHEYILEALLLVMISYIEDIRGLGLLSKLNCSKQEDRLGGAFR